MVDEIRMPQLDPEETGKQLLVITKLLDEMPSEPRDIHNWLQDKLMPVMGRLQAEVSGVMYYVGIQEDRIAALEEDAASLHPEDADKVLTYIKESLELLVRLQAETKIANLIEIIDHGKESAQIMEDYLEGADGEEEDDERSH